MSNSNTPTTPLTVQERVAEKVKHTFLDLVSDEEWKEMVAKQVKHFVEDEITGSGFHRGVTTSPLNLMIREELRECMLTKIKEVTSHTDWSGLYGDGCMLEPGTLALEISNQFSATGMQSMMASIVQQALFGFEQQVSNMIRNA